MSVHLPSYVMNNPGATAIESAKSKLECSVDQLFVEREGSQSRRHFVDRHDVHGLEHRYLPSDNSTHRARSRGLRRRVVAWVDGHFRFRRGGWKLEGF